MFLAILHKTDSHFTYSLDDPYIHLALSERIRHGLYGLNAGESASPSSSLIWPLLFVPFVGTRIFQYMPLVLNVFFGSATAWLFGYLIGIFDGLQRRAADRWRAPLLAALLLIATNLFGLAFTGLEHSLEVLLCVCCAYGVLQLQWERRISPVLLFAAVLLPSVRYEGVLPVFALACALWGANHRRNALLLMVGSLVPLVLFALLLKHLHLPALPLSVLVKAVGGATGSSTLHGVPLLIANLKGNYYQKERWVELLLFLSLAALTYRYRRSRGTAIALAGATLSAAAQVVAGPYGWFYRYEIYSMSFAAPIVIAGLLHTPALLPRDGVDQNGKTGMGVRPQIPSLLLLAVAAAAVFYAVPFRATPSAASSIYHQQVQMARFTEEYYKGPVAVNDLGLIAMHRGANQYVLDLVGLGSYEVFQAKRADKTFGWMEPTVGRHGIELVMAYPQWFGRLPTSWHPVARLCRANVKYIVGDRNVIFFTTPGANTALLLAQIARFKETLPAGSVMDLIGDDSPLTCPD